MIPVQKRAHKEFEVSFNIRTEPVANPILPSPKAICSPNVDLKVNVYTEFDPLKGVLIGWINESATLPHGLIPEEQGFRFGKYDDNVIEESQKNINEFAQKMLEQGVEVVRVADYDCSKRYQFEGEISSGFHCYSPRDVPFIFHDSIYEAMGGPVPLLLQFKGFDYAFNKLQKNGGKWYEIKGVRQNLKEVQQFDENSQKQTTLDMELVHEQPNWDSANILKIGLDILFLVSVSGNEQAYNFLKKHLEERYEGKVRLHPLRNVYQGVHVDATFSIIGFNKQLQKYLVVADGSYCKTRDNMPAIFRGKNWVVLEINQYHQKNLIQGYEGFCSERLGLNMFIVNPDLVVVDENQTVLIEALEYYGVKTLRCKNTFGRELGGSFHCMTNQYNREDVHGIGKVLETPKAELSEQQLAGFFDLELLKMLQESGDINEWVNICNQKNIKATYLTDHLKKEEQKEQQ